MHACLYKLAFIQCKHIIPHYNLNIVYSFIEFVPFLFTIPGVTSFLSEKVSQDPLEKFFGRQRLCGGVNDNPNVSQFLKTNQALRVINSVDFNLVTGNCRGSNAVELPGEENSKPLKKWHRVKITGELNYRIYESCVYPTHAIIFYTRN